MVDQLSSVSGLTAVRQECLRLVGEGHSSKEIAQILGLSHRTVDQYLHEATRSLGATNRRQAAKIYKESDVAIALKKLQLKPTPVVELPELSDREGAAETPRRSPLKLWLPPMGGPPNDLSTTAKLIAIGKTGLFTVLLMIAMVIVIKGAFVLFR